MARFELPSNYDESRIGKYLTDQLGSGYQFDYQTDELKIASVGRRGDLTRWLNESLFGSMTLVVSNNPLVGTALRFYPKSQYTLVVVRGIIPNETLRKSVLPWIALAVMFCALIVLQNGLGMAIFFGCLPLYLLLPRICAMSISRRVGRLLADADACRAAGIDPPPVIAIEIEKASPEQATRFRTFGGAKIILGLAIAGGATNYATTQLGRPYTSMLWEDTLYGCSIAAGLGLTLVYVGISNWFLRPAGWLKIGLMLVILIGLCAGGWAIVAPQVCPPRDKPSMNTAPENVNPPMIKSN